MKRLVLFLTFLFMIICPRLVVHAEFMPPAPPDLNTINLPGFLMDVFSTQMVQDLGVNVNPSDLDTLNQIINGRTVNSSLNYQYVDNANLGTLQDFYNSNGILVPQADSYTVLGTSDLCNYAFVCDKTTGEILYSYNEYNEMVSTLTAGNMRYPSLFPNTNTRQQQNIRNDINRAVDENLIVFSNTLSDEDMQTLARYDYYMTYSTYGFGYTVYVPNACTVNTVCEVRSCPYYEFTGSVPFGNNNEGYAWKPIIRTNYPAEVYYSTEGQWNYLQAETNSQYGYTFSYISNINVGSIPFWSGGYLDMHLPTQTEYQQFRELSDGSVYLQPAENNGETTNEYNYTNVTNNYTRPSPIINRNYDNRSETNYYNYPVTNNVTYPDYSETINNYTENIYQYYTTPNDNTSVGNLDPSGVTDNIPILSNLKYRFPFSIPFDLYNLFKSFDVERETLHFVGSLSFGEYYTWDYDLDFSPFNDVAEIVRTLFLISFIIGLAYFSYSHFFGS